MATGVYLYVRMDDEIRQHVERRLAEQLPQMSVSVGGARLVEGRGIAIYDLEITLPQAPRSEEPLLAIGELMLFCDVEMATLVRGTPPVQRVEVKHPYMALSRNEAGRWNFQSLLPWKPTGSAIPPIVIHGGEFSVSDATAAERQPLVLRDIELTVTPIEGGPSESTAPDRKALDAAWPSLRVEGTAGAANLKQLNLHAGVDGRSRQCKVEIDLQRFQLNDLVYEWLRPLLPPEAVATQFTAVIDGHIAGAWQAADIGAARPPSFSAKLALSNGRMEEPRLPQPVTDIAGKITADANQLNVNDLQGKWNGATLALSLNRTGWSARAPMALAARADNVALDEQLYRTLASIAQPPVGRGNRLAGLLREQLDKYKPTGFVDATLQARFDGQRWMPAASLIGRQLGFESDKFAYRLIDGEGRIDYRAADESQARPAQLDLDLYGVGGGQRLHIVGQVVDPKPAAAGWAQISGEELQIDDRLIAACDQRIAEAGRNPDSRVLASLKPSGKFNLTYWRIVRREPGGEPETSLRLDLTDVRINYDLFPYPLREIQGVIEARGNQWTFSNLVSGGRRTVTGNGSLLPGAAGHELRLRITGANVPLDDNLYAALQPEGSAGPSATQRAWQLLRPYGSINLSADIFHRVGQEKPNIAVQIQPLGDCSIKPVFFPYLMDDVSGTITYNDGRVALERMKAQHDGVAMGANGQGDFGPDGSWHFRLTGLWADSLSARPDLLTALPPKLTRLIDQLRPSGNFSLHNSELAFRQLAGPVPVTETSWDIQLECHQTDLNCGIPLNHITGSVRLQGEYNGQRSFSEGELNLETLTFQDVQFTNVQGPMWLDETQCLLGTHATNRVGRPARRVTSTVYSGNVASDAWIRFAALPQYAVEANVLGVDLSRLMVERFRAAKPLPGKVDAQVMLRGEGPAIEPLNGEGKVHIREANIYELPLLVRQLKLLRASVPDSTAFNESDVEFRIQGPHIYLDKINFLGDVVDLYGYGQVGFDRDVKLIFRPELGPREYFLPGVKHFVGHASQQVMQMYVDGTVDDPHVTTEAFPGINQVLQQLRIDLENTNGAAPSRAANRSVIGRAFGR